MNQERINEELIAAIEQLSSEVNQLRELSARTSPTSSKKEGEMPNEMPREIQRKIQMSEQYRNSICVGCDHAKIGVDMNQKLVFECLLDVNTHEPMLHCNKFQHGEGEDLD